MFMELLKNRLLESNINVKFKYIKILVKAYLYIKLIIIEILDKAREK